MTVHREIQEGLHALTALRRLRFVTEGALLGQVEALERALLDEMERLMAAEGRTVEADDDADHDDRRRG